MVVQNPFGNTPAKTQPTVFVHAFRVVVCIVVFGLPICMALLRIREIPTNLFAWLRLLVCFGALAIFMCAKGYKLRDRFLLAFVLESGSALLAFVYCDVPYFNSHGPEIAQSVSNIYGTLTHRSLLRDVQGIQAIRGHGL